MVNIRYWNQTDTMLDFNINDWSIYITLDDEFCRAGVYQKDKVQPKGFGWETKDEMITQIIDYIREKDFELFLANIRWDIENQRVVWNETN